MAAELFQTPDFEKCDKKRRCCDGDNKGKVYTENKPCIDGAEFNFAYCDCSWIGRGDVQVITGRFACNGDLTFCKFGTPNPNSGKCTEYLRFMSTTKDVTLHGVVLSAGQTVSECSDEGCTGSITTPFCPVALDLTTYNNDPLGERGIFCLTSNAIEGFICTNANQDNTSSGQECISGWLESVKVKPPDGTYVDLGLSYKVPCTPGGASGEIITL